MAILQHDGLAKEGLVQFEEFLVLFIPSLINWLVLATIMSLVVSKDKPQTNNEDIKLLPGGYAVIGLFIFTIPITVCGHNFLHLPPVP